MADLQSKGWIVAKGLMFGAIAMATAGLVLVESPSLRTAAFLGLLVWSSCRFYYFLFYVLERYVDASLRYAGLWQLFRVLWTKRPRKIADR